MTPEFDFEKMSDRELLDVIKSSMRELLGPSEEMDDEKLLALAERLTANPKGKRERNLPWLG